MSEHDDPRPPFSAADQPEPTAEPAVEPAAEMVPDSAAEVAEVAEAAAETTGDDRVDQALSRLSELDEREVNEHAAVFEDVHRSLQDALAEEEG